MTHFWSKALTTLTFSFQKFVEWTNNTTQILSHVNLVAQAFLIHWDFSPKSAIHAQTFTLPPYKIHSQKLNSPLFAIKVGTDQL